MSTPQDPPRRRREKRRRFKKEQELLLRKLEHSQEQAVAQAAEPGKAALADKSA
jgi:hypothetical protein